MANALAPAIAQRRSWARALVKDALTFSFSAVTEGSLDIQAVHGSGPTGPMIDSDWIAELGWEAMGASVRGAASGRTFISEVPLNAAEGFVRAARVTRDANVKLELRSRRVVKKQPARWRTTLDPLSRGPRSSGLLSGSGWREDPTSGSGFGTICVHPRVFNANLQVKFMWQASALFVNRLSTWGREVVSRSNRRSLPTVYSQSTTTLRGLDEARIAGQGRFRVAVR